MRESTKDKISGNWKQVKGRVKREWGSVTDDHLQEVEGEAERLVGVIEEQTGEERETVENRLDEIADQDR